MILAYGALNPDIVHVVDRLPGPGDDVRSRSWRLTWGGKAANMAVALATWDVDVGLTGLVIGEDPLGDALLAALTRPRLDVSRVERDPSERTRHCVVMVDGAGRRGIVCAGYADARWSAAPASWTGFTAVVADGFGGEQVAAVLDGARASGVPSVWLDAPAAMADRTDLVVWSRHEHSPEEAAAAAAHTAVVLTAGPAPIQVWWGDSHFTVVPPAVVPVDETGAGDVFAAACARGIASRMPPGEIVEWAAAAGAALVARGRERGVADRAEVDRLAEMSRR